MAVLVCPPGRSRAGALTCVIRGRTLAGAPCRNAPAARRSASVRPGDAETRPLMSCYLCAYQKTDRPQTVHPLPATSPVQPREELGTCWKCSVAACGLHGTRYWQFECAICTPAVATIQAFGAPARGELVPQDGGSPAAVIARLVGQRADPEQRTGVAHALVQIDAHLSGMREWSTADRWAAPGDEPNLVQNFRGIAEAFGVGDFVPEVQTGIEREADAPDGRAQALRRGKPEVGSRKRCTA